MYRDQVLHKQACVKTTQDTYHRICLERTVELRLEPTIVLGDRVFCSVSSGFSIHYNGRKFKN